jgi:polyhydroxyalkanoate synthesis regulator phasin
MSKNDSVEAMKLALEALKNSVDSVSNEAREAESLYGKYPSRLARIHGLVALEVAHQTAIKALEETLLKLDRQVVNLQCAHCQVTIDTLNDKVMSLLAKQSGSVEQGEPVAWLEGETIYWKEDQGLNDWIRANGTPLYTTPYVPEGRQPIGFAVMERPWIELTDEEVLQVRDDTTLDLRSHLDFYRACEAKRKAKNERLENNT